MKPSRLTNTSSLSPFREAGLEELEFPADGLAGVGWDENTGRVLLPLIPASGLPYIMSVSLPPGSLTSFVLDLYEGASRLSKEATAAPAIDLPPISAKGARVSDKSPTNEPTVMLAFDEFEIAVRIPNADVAASWLNALHQCMSTFYNSALSH